MGPMRAHPPEEDDDGTADPWAVQMDALGTFIRTQRQLARLSLRELASLTSVSNAYLSQIERGLHQPSLKVLRSIADALELNTEQILEQAGWAGQDKNRGNGRRNHAGSDDPDSSPRPTDTHTDTGTDTDIDIGTVTGTGTGTGTEEAIRRDPRLSDAQRDALLGVYRSFVEDSPG